MAQGKVRGRIARAAITAALTGAMALGGALAPATYAWAEDEDPDEEATLSPSVTITLKEAGGKAVTATKYDKAQLVFTATDIINAANPDGGLATNVQWASDSGENNAKDLVTEFLKQTKQQTGAGQTYIEWLQETGKLTGDNAKDTVKEYNDLGPEGKNVFDKASNAAQYIGIQIKESNDAGSTYDTKTKDPNEPKVTASGSFANNLQAALKDLAGVAPTPFSSDKLTLGTTGYYLLTGSAPAQPIWLPVDADDPDYDIYEKNNVPTFEKVATEDAEAMKKVVDAGKGEDVTFTLTATLPKGEYTRVVISDVLPLKGLDTSNVLTDVVVTRQFKKASDGELQGTAATLNAGADNDYVLSDNLEPVDAQGRTTGDGGYKEANKVGQRFSVTLNNKAGEKYVAGKEDGGEVFDEVITVTYSVKLTGDALMGAGDGKVETTTDGLNVNKATLSYGTDQTVSTESEAKVASYALKIVKVDTDDGSKINGIKFTIADSKGTPAPEDDVPLQADGSTEAKSYTFETGKKSFKVVSDGPNAYKNDAFVPGTDDAEGSEIVKYEYEDGEILVNRVDAATYVITETDTSGAPASKNYTPEPAFTVTVKPTYDEQEGTITALEAEVKAVDTGKTTKASVSADPATGLVTVTVPNGEAEVRLPVTGMTPSQLGTVVGAVLIAAGAVIIVRRRQQAEQA